MVMIELVQRHICRTQSGVSAHELHVFRGYIIKGVMIHDAQPSRTRLVAFSIVVPCNGRLLQSVSW